MATYFSQEWWDSRNTGQNIALALMTLPLGAARVGAAAVRGVQASRVGGAVRVASAVKRPVHSAMLWRAPRDLGFLGGQLSKSTYRRLYGTMLWRKRAGLVATGVSVLNPFQSIRYAQKKDWKRLAINLRYPIVGVPIYDYLQGRSGSPPPVASPTNQPIRDVGRHRRSQAARLRSKSGGPPSGRRDKSPKGQSSLSGGKGWGSKSVRPSGRPSLARRRRSKKCPAGHYYSWKLRRCVKSKYRK